MLTMPSAKSAFGIVNVKLRNLVAKSAYLLLLIRSEERLRLLLLLSSSSSSLLELELELLDELDLLVVAERVRELLDDETRDEFVDVGRVFVGVVVTAGVLRCVRLLLLLLVRRREFEDEEEEPERLEEEVMDLLKILEDLSVTADELLLSVFTLDRVFCRILRLLSVFRFE